MIADPGRAFRWHDGERTVAFGRGALDQAGELLPQKFTLLASARALVEAPELTAGAGAVHEVPAGQVDELAAALRPSVAGELLVALGGGRVIDVAKALAAADPPRRVAAIPTTLSGAEMTAIHRHAAGVAPATPRVRPAIVINDPELSASQPETALARSTANALGHAAEAMLTPLASPVPTLAALEAARLIAAGLVLSPHTAASRQRPDRDALALAALLAGYAIGSAGYGLHHVLAQTLARFAGVPHGAANAVMLPHSLAALQRRFPGPLRKLGSALGGDPVAITGRLATLSNASKLSSLEVTEQQLDLCADEAATRPELHLTSPPADRVELRALYAAAY